MGCVLHLDRFLFQPIWNQMYNCQFVWPFCLEYQNITCMDRSLSRCLSWARVIGIVWFSQTSKTLWNIRESLNEAKPCNKLQTFKPTDKISESFLLTKVCYWQRQRQRPRQRHSLLTKFYWQRQRQRQSFLLTKTKFFIDKSLLLTKTKTKTKFQKVLAW